MCRLDSSLSIVLIWVHLCLPMALMKNLVSVFVWSIFSIAEFLKVVISWQKGGWGGRRSGLVGLWQLWVSLHERHCIKGSQDDLPDHLVGAQGEYGA